MLQWPLVTTRLVPQALHNLVHRPPIVKASVADGTLGPLYPVLEVVPAGLLHVFFHDPTVVLELGRVR